MNLFSQKIAAFLGGVLLFALIVTTAAAEDGVLPDDAMVNVTRPVAEGGCGLVGDGRVDNTAALLKCIKAHANLEQWEKDVNISNSPLYFPNGTYLVSDTIGWQAFLFLQGQSRDKTILKLANNADGFNDRNAPKPFIGLGENQKDFYGVGFRNMMRNFTLEVGVGNPGAVALSYYGSNQSSAENIVIKTSDPNQAGWAGVAERGGACPGLLKNITVDGFDYGLVPASGCTHENITLRRQNRAGLFCTSQNNQQPGYDGDQRRGWGGGVGVGGKMVAILNLVSENRVPAVDFNRDTGEGAPACGITLINANLTGGAAGTAAIHTIAPIYARNVTTQGYQFAIHDEFNNRKTGATVREYASETYATLPNGDLSLHQTFKATPDSTYPSATGAKWASVVAFGANPDDRTPDTAAIQRAIDSGAEVVYFPAPTDQDNQTSYVVDDTIVIRQNVRFVLGLGHVIKSYGGLAGKTLFRIEETRGDAVVFDHVNLQYFDNAMDHNLFEHNSRKNLVIKSSLLGTRTNTSRIQYSYFSSIENPGILFIEDVVGGGHFKIEKNGEMYAKQFNINNNRAPDRPTVINHGGVVSIMQWRPENPGRANTLEPLMRTTNGGSTEILSTWIDNQNSGRTDPQRPAFEVINANLFVNARFPGWGFEYARDPAQPFKNYVNFHIAVREIQNQKRDQLLLYNTRRLGGGSDYSVTAYVTGGDRSN
ncbi:MAG: glycosyl hydrolase family 28-related protein [Nodosilinea sp.]